MCAVHAIGMRLACFSAQAKCNRDAENVHISDGKLLARFKGMLMR